MLRLLFFMALRNLIAHRATTLIVGAIVAFGSFVVVFGAAVIDSIDRAMANSIVTSVSGHLQIYDKNARDELALFGSGFMGSDDIGMMPSFADVRAQIGAHPNVKAVVPMGIHMAQVTRGSGLSDSLTELRSALQRGDAEEVSAHAEKVRSIAQDVLAGLKNRTRISSDQKDIEADIDKLARIDTDAFWGALNAGVNRPNLLRPRGGPVGPSVEDAVLQLETTLGPMMDEGAFLYFRNLGTDLEAFGREMGSFEIVEGEKVPEGQRGYLFSKSHYERFIKNKVAYELDELWEQQDVYGKKLVDDPELADRARRLPRQYRRITHELSPENSRGVSRELAVFLKKPADTPRVMKSLVEELLTVTNDNLKERREFFYAAIAPKLKLYSIPIGSVVTLRAVSKSGYYKSLNIKLYGTYRFRGLEESDLAGAFNLMDMVSFRELFGVMTAAQKEELAAIKAEVGVVAVDRDAAEEALFGGEAEPTPTPTAPMPVVAVVAVRAAPAPVQRSETVTQSEIDSGFALSAAVILNDPDQLAQTRAELEASIEASNLPLKIADWRQASGIVAQFVLALRGVLYAAIVIVFLVALVIINNAMVLATTDRTQEIGTLRAIGAQRRFVTASFLVEVSLLSLCAGIGGALCAYGLISYLHGVGIPAPARELVFLFSGPRLFPSAQPEHLLWAFVAVIGTTLASTYYPARIASRIHPVVAMQSNE